MVAMMTSRERLLTSLAHGEPDRLAIMRCGMMNTRQPYDPAVTDYLDIALHRDVLHAFADRIHAIHKGAIMKLLEAAGDGARYG